jgi:hypothetical protein
VLLLQVAALRGLLATEQQRCDESAQQLVDEQQLTQQLQRQLAALKSQMVELSQVQGGLQAEQLERQELAVQVGVWVHACRCACVRCLCRTRMLGSGRCLEEQGLGAAEAACGRAAPGGLVAPLLLQQRALLPCTGRCASCGPGFRAAPTAAQAAPARPPQVAQLQQGLAGKEALVSELQRAAQRQQEQLQELRSELQRAAGQQQGAELEQQLRQERGALEQLQVRRCGPPAPAGAARSWACSARPAAGTAALCMASELRRCQGELRAGSTLMASRRAGTWGLSHRSRPGTY